MALAKVAELAIVLRGEKRTQNELKIILQFESANLDAKQKAFDLHIENVNLKRQMEDEKLAHVKIMADFEAAKAKEISDASARYTEQITSLKKKPLETDAKTLEVLQMFFDQPDGLPSNYIAQCLKVKESVADFYIDELLKRGFIRQTRIGISGYGGNSPPIFSIIAAGREFLIRNGLT